MTAAAKAKRILRLGAFMRPVSIHTGAWRYPDAYPDANFNFGHIKRFAQRLETAKFDAFFMADHLAVLNMPMEALKRSATVTSFEPMTLLPALAAVTGSVLRRPGDLWAMIRLARYDRIARKALTAAAQSSAPLFAAV